MGWVGLGGSYWECLGLFDSVVGDDGDDDDAGRHSVDLRLHKSRPSTLPTCVSRPLKNEPNDNLITANFTNNRLFYGDDDDDD